VLRVLVERRTRSDATELESATEIRSSFAAWLTSRALRVARRFNRAYWLPAPANSERVAVNAARTGGAKLLRSVA
jgi:hypothetical protein